MISFNYILKNHLIGNTVFPIVPIIGILIIIPLTTYELEIFLKENPKYQMSIPTIRRGLNELVKSKIVAPSAKIGAYYINPNFIFNGDRVRFITEIKRKVIKNIK